LIQIKELRRGFSHNPGMATQTTRKIVHIDEEKCNGCGDCIPNCAEGALRIIEGKAKLVADKLCDGLGACLGHCPMGAITVEERPAEEFDELAVRHHLHPQSHAAAAVAVATAACPPPAHHGLHAGGGCPGSRTRMLQPKSVASLTTSPAAASDRPSRLGQWPVQLTLLPPAGPMWENADVLIAADCVPFAYPDFHEKMLAGKTLAIACPKLDDVEPYVQKLAYIFANNTIRSITIAHMEVPCCSGIVRVVRMALEQAGRNDIPVRDITVGIDGEIRGV
jgi:ferredoxin